MPTPGTKLLQGTLDMLILKALSLGPLHGYGIGQRIVQMSEDVLRVEEGSLYPALYRLEERGWIKGRWIEKAGQRRRCHYRITEAGRRVLADQREDWSRFVTALGQIAGVKYA